MRYSIDRAEPKRYVPARYENTPFRAIALEIATREWIRRENNGKRVTDSMNVAFWDDDGQLFDAFRILRWESTYRGEFVWAMRTEHLEREDIR